MVKISIPLSRWIVLSASRNSRGPPRPAAADAWSAVSVARTIEAALLLLARVRGGGDETADDDDDDDEGGGGEASSSSPPAGESSTDDSTPVPADDAAPTAAPAAALRADDIAVENFSVEIDLLDEAPPRGDGNGHDGGGGGSSDDRIGGKHELKAVGVHFSATSSPRSRDDESMDGDETARSDDDNNARLRRIGSLLHSLFGGGGGGATLTSPPPNEPGRGSSGSNGGMHHPSKRTNRSSNLAHRERMLFPNDDVPASIRRLVSDLMLSGKETTENPFVSVDDVILELKEIRDRPELLQPPSRGEPLNFGKDVYGRTRDFHRFLQVVSQASIETNPSESKLILIGGAGGSGKSTFVGSVKGPLSNLGFAHVTSKFDRPAGGQRQPLSVIAAAFDEFFASLAASRRRNGAAVADGNAESIVASMERDLDVSGIAILSNLMPSIRDLFPQMLRRVVSDPDFDLSNIGEERTVRPPPARDLGRGNLIQDEEDAAPSDVASSRNRLHHLFRRLVRAISSRDRPVLLTLDDLQWADRSAMDLISSLLLDFDHLGRNNDINQYFLVVGTYRDNEVDKSHTLFSFLKKFDESQSVCVTKINLGSMPSESANVMLSKALSLPSRLTRSLTGVVMSKTLGNPFHIKAFVNSLGDEHILYYSLLEKRWVWDLNEVKAVSIDESVAELLTRRLLRLPQNLQESLKVVSCFGSQISYGTPQLLSSLAEWRGLVDGLDGAVEENILEKSVHGYTFVHDMLQQASYELMDEEDCHEHHYKIGMQLMSSGPPRKDSNFDHIEFAAIGQINRAKTLGAMPEVLWMEFATLNLKAGKLSIEVSAFVSALSYLEYGIAFLHEAAWDSHYELSLALHENAALSCYALGLVGKMKFFLKDLFEHADCFEDSLRGYYMLIQSLAGVGDVHQAVDKILRILSQLGEDFPDQEDITPELITEAIISTKSIVRKLPQEGFLPACRMTDRRKIWTMKYLAMFILYSGVGFRQKYLPLVASRIIKISVSHGYTNDSAFGFLGLGHALIVLAQDIENGYKLGKMALLLLESLNAKDSRVKFRYYGVFAFWEEPVQAVTASLREIANESLAVGDTEYAALSSFACCRQSFFAGENLALVEKECSASISMMVRLQQINVLFVSIIHRHTFLKLMGSDRNFLDDINEAMNGATQITSENDLLQYLRVKSKSLAVEVMGLKKLIHAFWFKRYEEAWNIATEYENKVIGFASVAQLFPKGLVALNLARHTGDKAKMDVGEKALSSFRMWSKHSKWNFENKFLLLEAEWHFTKGEMSEAEQKYTASVESARSHRFVHEEGLASELLSIFHTTNGNVDKGKMHLSEARACYEKWGAQALVKRLDSSLQ